MKNLICQNNFHASSILTNKDISQFHPCTSFVRSIDEEGEEIMKIAGALESRANKIREIGSRTII